MHEHPDAATPGSQNGRPGEPVCRPPHNCRRVTDVPYMPDPVYLPAAMVVTPGALPPICQRHLRPAIAHKSITFYSRPPWWVYLFLPFGPVLVVLLDASIRKSLTSPTWAVCQGCRERRRTLLLRAVGALLIPVLVTIVGAPDVVWVVGCCVGVIAVAINLLGRQYVHLAAAEVTRDASALKLRKPSPDYVHALPPMNVPGSAMAPSIMAGAAPNPWAGAMPSAGPVGSPPPPPSAWGHPTGTGFQQMPSRMPPTLPGQGPPNSF